ncbi:Acyl-CoA dehydrogenase fadE12 [Corynebacterium urogenitale]|uniref:Acyl-CoA dehydrogenase fadE12 n=1 Tax=Corynebacterium urogenitale TaxID=2487892 RepID=A0A5J6ZAD6_9CORY|nr:acyl-CoA dehydrogenase family protein [Corynebacterium urogenitale]QFQ03242.1 Acyl-CoA dehydrogenase fadE12 [Corynebacterium urogenitale]
MKIGIIGAGIAGLALANLLDHAKYEIQLIDSAESLEPIGAAISHPLAEVKIDIELARNMTFRAASDFDSGADCGASANYSKFAAARAAVKSVDRAIQTHGGNGFVKDYRVSELFWPARLFRTAPVSEEMILNYVANNILGMCRSY